MANRKESNEPANMGGKDKARHDVGDREGRVEDVGHRSDLTPQLPGLTASPQQHEQHTRKGQAQSPRDLNHFEPPGKKEGHS